MTYLDNRGLFRRRPRPTPPTGRTPIDEGTRSGAFSCPIPIPFGFHYDSAARLMWRYDFDGVGLLDPVDIDEFIAARRPMPDDLGFLEDHLNAVHGVRTIPPHWPSPAWPRFIRKRLVRRYVRRWFRHGQGVALKLGIDNAYAGRSGYVRRTFGDELGSWHVEVRLAGGTVEDPDFCTEVFASELTWLDPEEAERRRVLETAEIDAQRFARMQPDPDKHPGLQRQAPPPRDGILHPHRRLQV